MLNKAVNPSLKYDMELPTVMIKRIRFFTIIFLTLTTFLSCSLRVSVDPPSLAPLNGVVNTVSMPFKFALDSLKTTNRPNTRLTGPRNK